METRENVVAALFDVESEAYQAFTELKNSPVTSSYTIAEAGLVAKRDGRASLVDQFTAGPATVDDTLAGAGIGALVGVFGGPMGMLLGSSTGMLAGSFADGADDVRNKSLVNITAGKLYDGETAIVALVQETDEIQLDGAFAKYGAQVMRRDAATVEEEVDELLKVQKDAEEKARAALRKEKNAERKAKIDARRKAIKAKFSRKD